MSLAPFSAEENPLETRLMRQRAQFERNNSYKHIAIRLVVNSNIILQGLFYPQESISNLIEFARTNLVSPQIQQSDFYLYTSPPRVVLSDLNKSLSAYDLAPASYVYLGHRTISPLVIQLASSIPIETIENASEIVTRYVFNRTRSTNEEEGSSVEPNGGSRPTKRNTSGNNVDDKQLRDKMRKFLPGKK
jgi:hypothetical protein